MLKKLEKYLQELSPNGIALAFSGGVDSTLLLMVLKKIYDQKPFKLKILTAATVLQNPAESKEAEEKLKNSGLPYEILHFNPLQIEQVYNNRLDRCYWCKKNIFSYFRENINSTGIKYLIDGTNADDIGLYRPGLKALKELGVHSPLAELGINKTAIRKISAELGLNTANKPSSPCMATRFAYNVELTAENLALAAKGEEAIKNVCPQIHNLRLRIDGIIARIEVDEPDFPLLLENRREIVRELKKTGFEHIVLDLEGFHSGSQDKHLMKG